MAAAMILVAAGAEWHSIEADYLFSNVRRKDENNRRLEQVAQLVAGRAGRSTDELDLGWMRGLFVVEPRYLVAARREIEERYGGIAGLLEEGLGLDDTRLEQLRERIVEG